MSYSPASPVSIMPCLDIRGGRVVKGVHFESIRDAGDPVECARTYEAAGADELGFLDITATIEGRATVYEALARVADAVKIPVTLGGGIRSLADVERALKSGAAKVSVSSAAYRDPQFIADAVKEFGGEKIVIAIDADVNESLPSKREVYIDGGRTGTGTDAVEFAKKMAGFGAGSMLPTSKLGDGTKAGYDLVLTSAIADATDLPTIASGGAGTLEHFLAGVVEGHAATLLAASVFHYGILTVAQVKSYLREHQIPVR